MGPKGKEKRKEAKRQKWKPLDAETKQSTEETEPKSGGDATSNPTESKSSSVATTAPTPIEPTCDPQFRKRGLTSNWSRYDEPVEVETEYNRKRGEDFDLLLSASAGASAHFRFKEQQDWQDEPAELSEFLSIDCDTIVEALQTIPVHERLGLPEDIFPANVIQEFKNEAAACKEKYEAFLRTGKRQTKTVPDVGESLKNSLQAAIIAAVKPKSKPTKEDDDLEELLDLSLKSPRSDDSGKGKKKGEDERNLEFLLSLTEQDNEKDVVPAAEETATTILEPKLKAAEEAVKPAPLKTSSQPEPQKPTVDLEDWLDSVLQD
ncbi:cell death regulator Aven isoform X2 [Dermacentor silvarum]|uniref:cell death regulator Aven isoform X2 n=1 Tax=Dermacentor silvarum TaxID=543639 RepID=UPI00189A7797|nr:cell death regulator Aven isoform X2 [Dermacentor silvarum]